MTTRGELAGSHSCLKHRLVQCLLAMGPAGCLVSQPGAEPHQETLSSYRVPRAGSAEARTGSLRVLTYNAAGLPGFLTGLNPDVNHALASPLLNRYDLVFAQEDFSYHRQLVRNARHPYDLSPQDPSSTMFGDGLCALSVFPFEYSMRVRWQQCYGYLGYSSDCFGEKGFLVARVYLAHGVGVDLYNLHAEAGEAVRDLQSRRDDFEQLAAYIRRYSSNHALIVVGDTNLDTGRSRYDAYTFRQFIGATGLRDSCREHDCRNDRVDRILFRGSHSVGFDVLAYEIDPRFVDAQGHDLSDHQPVAVELGWRALQP